VVGTIEIVRDDTVGDAVPGLRIEQQSAEYRLLSFH
jgi:hypothetical protein